MAAKSNVQDWNQATNLVITGQAGGQIMGDWAQGEFQVAGQVAGKDYTCLPGLGVNEIISTGGDAFYFPKLNDPEKTAAQEVLASTMLSPTTQVAFNLKKGSLPVRGDVDLAAANDCMKKGLDILAKGNVIPVHRPVGDAGYEDADQRSVLGVLRDADDDGRRRAEALRRHHRGRRVEPSAQALRTPASRQRGRSSRSCRPSLRPNADMTDSNDQAPTASSSAI